MNISCYDYLLESYKRNGNFPAVIAFGSRTSMSKFIHDVDSIASYISSLGIVSGDAVTVFLPNIPHAFTAFYALNKIGVIANIVHPLTSPDALKESITETHSKAVFILDMLAADYIDAINECDIPCIICSNSDYLSVLKAQAVKIYEKQKSGKLRFNNSTTYFRALVSGALHKSESVHTGELTAVYLHGGGTTGKSKTIMLSSNNINAIAEKLDVLDNKKHKPGEECSLVVLPMFHAFGLAVAMHYPITHGFTCIPLTQFTGESANKMLRKYNISFILGVPNMFKKMLDDEKFKGEHLKKLRLVFCGGDFLPERFVREFNKTISEFGGKGRLFRGYGLTEVASVCTVNSYGNVREDSIGKPLPGMVVEIWDEMNKKLPDGQTGEIVIRGETVMQGYFKGDETAENDGVYIDKNGNRWIKSGDLGYFDKDGFLFFTGRKKRMIIISGYNVYPSDIENAVLQLPFVAEACAVQGYHKSRPCVKLCVTLKEEIAKEEAKSQIQSYCKKNLAKFSCPRKIEIYDSFPRTKMAKIDFMKLSDKYESQ